MLTRGFSITAPPISAVERGWPRTRRRQRRPKGSTIRLGNRRRGFCLGVRPVVQWAVVARPFRLLKKLVAEMAANGRLLEAYCRTLPLLRPQFFPLC
ncbi:hypothetical protein C2S51_023447 [Perilla frutescens var. frutescens]|nr:hypothetical protein C2S51_023447 [Perilla frutescens var. frutescens]